MVHVVQKQEKVVGPVRKMWKKGAKSVQRPASPPSALVFPSQRRTVLYRHMKRKP